MSSDEILAALNIWRDGLVNLSGVNRLIRFRHSKNGSLLVQNPDAETVLGGLHKGTVWEFVGQPDGDGNVASTEGHVVQTAASKSRSVRSVLHIARPEKELGSVLRNMRRRASAEMLDRGLSVLYMAFGTLHWKDEDDVAMSSPLLLVPVKLESEGPNTVPSVALGEDDTVMNPSLILRMRDFGIEIPALDDIPELSVRDLMAEVRRAVSTKAEWSVEPTVILSTFSFHKEAMYRDLLENENAVLNHPVVRALGTKDPARQSADFLFEPIEPTAIDRIAPPEETPLVLDADSSQRAAVAAAVAGRSFVMDGPPGTGKSQTIANMVGALLHAGRTVLFVSEKAAALEVVRNRLADAGLESYLLELHSHKASRKEVATALAHSLDNITLPPQGMADLKRSTLVERRNQLNDYAAAMNEIRDNLGLTLHDVLGLLSAIHDVPSAPLPETAPEDLNQSELHAIRNTARELERSWRPAQQGQSYLWRDVVDQNSLDVRLYHARTAVEALEGQVGPDHDLLQAFSLNRPSGTRTLIELLRLQHEMRPALIEEAWLTTTDWDAVSAARNDIAAALAAIAEAEGAVVRAAKVAWHLIPKASELPAPAAVVVDAAINFGPLTQRQCTAIANEFEHHHEAINRSLSSVRAVALELGLDRPDTFSDIERVLQLAGLGYSQTRPLKQWLSAESLGAARSAAAELQAEIARLDAAEAAAAGVFSEAVLGAPVGEIFERFQSEHRGLKKLSGQYRADKKTVAGWLIDGVPLKSGIAQLNLAADWSNADAKFRFLSNELGGALGAYWKYRDTDFQFISAAIEVADNVLELVGRAGIPRQLAIHVTAEPNPALKPVIECVRRDVSSWISSLKPSPALAGMPELAFRPVQQSLDWLQAHIGPLRAAAVRIEAVSEVSGDRALTLTDVDEILRFRDVAENVNMEFDRAAGSHESILGALFRGRDTDLAEIDRAIEWASQIRRLAGGSLTAVQRTVLKTSHPLYGIDVALAKWEDARDRVINAFDESRHAELSRELDDYRTAPRLIDEFREDSIGQEEWFAYSTAREHLEKHGLGAAIDFCVDERVPANQVPQVIERALLRSWADHTIQRDARLRPVMARDRAALVEEYRTLDRQHIELAACDIIRAANTRRPSSAAIGEPGVIRREGMKKSRHLPVRELISRTRNTSLAIKPCFMMSPLAVSQYLPADMKFDVVIFDEASQVRPGDAINCIYRGNALILAGDDRQLPPTSFFERADDDNDDTDTDVAEFQSVLELAKGSGAFNNLRLKWHYRSRHEGLIAFSNYQFYDGGLITYPSARSEASDVGVEYIRTDGVYRRGGGADNPREAEKVAERVLHHFSTRPHLTLGVVTFSVSQADAIVDAIAKARESRRDLDRHFDESDRLNSFFVKSLESVQGDERDIIIFSIGYGPDEAGKVTTNFGVLNKPKGWRRLNVAITRARQRVEVVASLSAAQIPPSQNENVEHLRAYLDYAERGPVTLALNTGSSGLGPESPFEESVLRTIRNWGYTVEPQVGSAGYRIDIGLRHPAQPGIYALGIECDGYQYHSAPAARDRDRLRDQVLGGLGWRLHRIWGTAWYRHRQEEESRLRAAIEDAINAPEDVKAYSGGRQLRPLVTTAQVEFDAVPRWTTEYESCVVPALPRWADPSEDGSGHHMVKAIKHIAQEEGPVHLDIVFLRLRDAWGLGRIGHRIRSNIETAITLSEPFVERNAEFIDVKGRTVDRVRTTGDQERRVEHVSESEMQLAITLLLRDAGATQREELAKAVARIFGWNRSGAEISRRVNGSIDELLDVGAVEERDTGDLSLAT